MNGDILPTDVLIITAASVVFAAVMHSSRESVLIAMLLHATNNTVSGEFASQLFTGSDKALVGWLQAAGWWVVAAVCITVHQRRQAGARGAARSDLVGVR